MLWWILSISAVGVLLAFARKGRNAVWGTAMVATFIGVGIALYQPGFDWRMVGKAMVIGTFVGLAFDWLPQLPKLWSKSRLA